MFARSQAMRRPNANISPVDAQNEMLLKQSIGEIIENESLESRIDKTGSTYSLQENSENSRNLGSSQSIKLLTNWFIEFDCCPYILRELTRILYILLLSMENLMLM